MSDSSEKADALLRAFFEAAEGPEAERLLTEVISAHAAPLIHRILRRRTGRSWRGGQTDLSVEDIHGQVVVQLLRRLRGLKAGGLDQPIADFLGYVAATTYRAYFDALRDKYPERHRLRNKLRYVLGRAPALALWEGEGGGPLCGLAAWRGRARPAPAADGRPFPPSLGPVWLEGRPVEFLVRVFEWAGAPLELDELVEGVERLCGLPHVSRPVEPDHPAPTDPVAQAHDRIFLQQLWTQIAQLPLASGGSCS